jgi:hypothetical protein
VLKFEIPSPHFFSVVNMQFGCLTTNFVGCLPLAAVHHFRLTKGFPKNSRLQRHLAD